MISPDPLRIAEVLSVTEPMRSRSEASASLKFCFSKAYLPEKFSVTSAVRSPFAIASSFVDSVSTTSSCSLSAFTFSRAVSRKTISARPMAPTSSWRSAAATVMSLSPDASRSISPVISARGRVTCARTIQRTRLPMIPRPKSPTRAMVQIAAVASPEASIASSSSIPRLKATRLERSSFRFPNSSLASY